ncbi:hypothetical protein NDU88_000858 [Pleurodeles waltl]|uniref:Uncharacterized protein n=1 Tax=Pleurodeles waltl TaxID=8319 RepID=A0AAV7UR78_PLEWA|nr:hypothetical protein NDU88_000858 [Pleurodeles waltl]
MELLQAIQGSQLALENKIETVALAVNLLCIDLCEVSDKVCLVEGSIEEFQTEVSTPKKQVAMTESRSGGLWKPEWRFRRSALAAVTCGCWDSLNEPRGRIPSSLLKPGLKTP